MPYNLRGVVKNGGVPEGGWTVRAILHSNGSLVAEDMTSSSGSFEFVSVANAPHDIYAFDDMQPEQGGQIFVAVTPVFESLIGDHRYWRLVNINTGGGFLEISEIVLLSEGSDVTSQATILSSDDPTSGAIEALIDGNLSTRCFWSEAIVEDGDFFIEFDFGIGNAIAINGVKQGGFDTSTRYMESFTLQFSDDGSSWTSLGTKSALTYPGDHTLSTEYTFT